MKKVVIENGKVVSATGELPMLNVIANLGEDGNNNNNNATDTSSNLENTSPSSIDELEEVNTVKSDAKLPQTGEETNEFTKWLSIAISLGIFWLVSMLLIDREKKKMTKK